MAMHYTPQQKNAIRCLERLGPLVDEAAGRSNSSFRAILREFLEKIRHRDLFEYDKIYPHELPHQTLVVLLRLKDPVIRADAIKALFALPHAPKPVDGTGKVIHNALEHAPDVIALLHAKGFTLPLEEVRQAEMNLALAIEEGHWPHMDLICPNFWNTARPGFLHCLLVNPPAPGVEIGPFLDKLSTLPSNTPAPQPKVIAHVLIDLSSNAKSAKKINGAHFQETILKISRRGWLDLTDAAIDEKIVDTPGEHRLRECLSLARHEVLDQTTPVPLTHPRPARL